MIKDLEKEAAIKRAKENKKAGKAVPTKSNPDPIIQELPEDDEELIQLIKKAAEARAKKEQLDKLVVEAEEQDKRDRAVAKLPPGMLDPPSRNTRSKTEELRAMPRVVEVTEPKVELETPKKSKLEEVKAVTPEPRPDTPSKNTRRRTKKA